MPEAPATRPLARLTFDADEVAATTLAQGWRPPPGDAQTMEGGGISIQVAASRRTFEPGLHFGALAGGGVAFADTTTWTIRVAGPDGDLSRNACAVEARGGARCPPARAASSADSRLGDW